MSMNELDLEVAAYHEAGHAVVAWALSVPVLEVQVGTLHKRILDGLGWREINSEIMSQSDWKYAEKKARILLGGEMAERAFDEQAWVFLSETDRRELGELIQQLPFSTEASRRKWLDKMKAEVETIVCEYWTTICALAKTLMQRSSLSGSEATRIIRGDGLL